MIYASNSTLLYTFGRMYRGLITWVLCCFYLAINVYVWQRVGINHVLIFELDARKRVLPATFLELSSAIGYVCTLSMLMFLHHKEFGVDVPYHFPLISIGLPLLLLINPIPMLHLKARMWILRCFGRIVAAPFFHVQFADFWIADQLTSLVQCIVDNYHLVRFYFRYYMKLPTAFDFEPDFMVPIIRCLPPWFRLAQCLRRYYDKHNKPHLYFLNACKYFSSIIVVIFSTILMETSGMYIPANAPHKRCEGELISSQVYVSNLYRAFRSCSLTYFVNLFSLQMNIVACFKIHGYGRIYSRLSYPPSISQSGM